MTATAQHGHDAKPARKSGAAKHRRGTGQGPAAPERRCLASGRVLPKAELLRFVVGPEGVLVPDLAERLPGRGLWLQARRDMMDKACTRNLFAKAAKRQVRLPEDLPRQVEDLLLKRCLELLGLARRAGAVSAGFEKVRSALRAGEVGLLVQADDAAADGRDKVRALARAVGPKVPLLAFCGAAELGAAVGREAAVHVAVAPGRFAESLTREIQRLAALRGVADRGTGVGRPTEGER
jgi:predicted RNA-binding protein YlxR (DUF448 family)/ribosomal protein L30E